MNRFLMWLTGFLPARIISDDGKPYLERYYLFTVFGVRAYLHQFVGSDPDRGLHDHPWRWAYSFILSGFYYEENRYGKKRVRWFNSLTGDSFHRVVLPQRYVNSALPDPELRPCWTLFLHKADYEKPWGFLRQKGQLGMTFTPYPYKAGETSGEKGWWITAPTGREIREK
jgi:hypothetical protein